MTALTTPDLTTASTSGTGVFDVLMRSLKAHLDEEFKRGAIKGPEYATVYLGSMNLAMQTGLSFLLQKQKTGLEADILAQQLLLAQKEVEKATVQLAILTASQAKIPAEIAQLEAQTLLIGQQKTNLTAEGLNIPKQGQLLDGQVLLVGQQKTNLISEELGIVAKTALTNEQLQTEVLNNFIHPTDPTLSGKNDQERQIGKAQVCKLTAEFDLVVSTTTKSAGEIALLAQKTTTERAQVLALGVDDNSVIGKQKLLYAAQTNGFTRDAEQKAAKVLIDTWSVRRTTDEATVADATNMLNDVAVGRAVTKLLTGVGA